MLHHVRKLAAEAHQYQEILPVKLLHLGELLHPVTQEAVTADEFVARHNIRHGDANAVKHRLYLLRAVAHAVEHDLLIRLPEVVPQAAVNLIKKKCHCLFLCILKCGSHHAYPLGLLNALHESLCDLRAVQAIF